MFDFEKLEVYQKANSLNIEVLKLLRQSNKMDSYIKDQLKRATLSIVLNIAEGCGRVSGADKKRFYTIARSSVFECVAILNVLKECNELEKSQFDNYYEQYEVVSKMILGLYRKTKTFNT